MKIWVSLKTRPDTKSQSIKSMCPMLPNHNFLVSGADWPTEKHIKKLAGVFPYFLEIIYLFFCFEPCQDYTKMQISPIYGKTSAQFFYMFFSWPFCSTHKKNCGRATSGTLILCFWLWFSIGPSSDRHSSTCATWKTVQTVLCTFWFQARHNNTNSNHY